MAWILAVALIISVLYHIRSGKQSMEQFVNLTEYVQFLFFCPDVYEAHREQFIALLKKPTAKDAIGLAMYASNAIEYVAARTNADNRAFAANVFFRANHAHSDAPPDQIMDEMRADQQQREDA